MGLCSFFRRILSGRAQKQSTRQELVPAPATKFGLAAILETQAAPANDLTSARPTFLTVTAQPEPDTTSLTCSPKAPSPPQTVSYQGYFGLHDSVPTLADRRQWMTISSASDMFQTTQAWGAASEKYWAWVSNNSHALFLAEKEALAESRAFMACLLQRPAGDTSESTISCLTSLTDSCSVRNITGCMGCLGHVQA